MIGRTFGRYRIVKPLGEGGMGIVWKAEDDLLGRSVALKLLSARLVDSESARSRLLREARAAGALDHPGIGTVYDAGEQDGAIFIAMRLVDGGTVSDRLASQGALGLLDAMRIAASAADALGHAHARGVLHRDISPRNLMLTQDGQVVVVDFGLALAEGVSRVTQAGAIIGTAYYVPPETARGEQVDRRSDIYSLGAVLYEMLTGAPPFEGEHLQTVLYAAVNTPAAPPSAKRPGIPPELDRIVLKSLAKVPEERYATMEALRDDLEALVASGSVQQDESALMPIVTSRRRTLSPRPTPDPSLTPTVELVPASTGGLRGWTRVQRVASVGAAVVVVALSAAGIVRFAWRSGASPAAPVTYSSLAVLPFKNTSATPAESEYLSEGLSQAVINRLTQVSNLRVPPWMTARRFVDSTIPVEKLAADLRVDALLVGTFQEEGTRIRGTVSIVDGKSGFQIWADEFDEPLADIFKVQNRIAMAAATRLLGKLSGGQVEVLTVPAGASVEAYELYLRGSYAMHKQTQIGDEEALGFFRRATTVDPRFAPGWEGLGAALYDVYFMGWGGGIKELVAAEEAFNGALELDPNSVSARRGLIRVFWEYGKSEECLKQGKLVAASGARGSDATLARAEAYMLGGLYARSLPLLQQVMADDPANPAAPWFMTVAACWAGRYQEAVNAGEKYLAAFGEDSEVQLYVALAYHSMGRRKEAESNYRRAIETVPRGSVRDETFYAAAFFRQDGRVDESDRLMLERIDVIEEKLLRNPNNYRLRTLLGGAYGMVGDLSRMREEESRVRDAMGDAGLQDFPVYLGVLGEKKRFVDTRRAMLRAGNLTYSDLVAQASLYADPHLEGYPGYKELAAEEAVELKRLEALY